MAPLVSSGSLATSVKLLVTLHQTSPSLHSKVPRFLQRSQCDAATLKPAANSANLLHDNATGVGEDTDPCA